MVTKGDQVVASGGLAHVHGALFTKKICDVIADLEAAYLAKGEGKQVKIQEGECLPSICHHEKVFQQQML